MEWGRAKNVLIFAFLVLNIVLGYQLWSNIQEGPSTSGDVNDLSPGTLAVMREKGIKLTARSIPTETPKLSELTYRVTEKLGEGKRQMLETPVDGKIVFNEKELLNELGPVIPELKEYRYDPELNEDEAFVLHRIIEDRPMFDVRLKLYYSNQKIVAYSQDRVELITGDEAAEQTVLPATKALESLIYNHFKPGAVIKDIKLGYHGLDFNSDTQFSAPSWRVLLEDGQVYYVHAISAEVFTEKEEAPLNGAKTE
ncbi:two-component system regulatory protein YycI [Paenibacillus spongiae]|uniref:Two-component system regulatory protein YycI n=1 Tax=Paenibacillus spongiae TaxID=2909671 RepID=A0ABY5SDD6_9BACL|nr:two-component system regulatory protein YycI [Paenibacillus spongiae]UVI30298.1 two-component system regulatory protein YycI [Paenibacillus spongiae]